MPLPEMMWMPLRELDLVDRRMRRFFADLGVAPTLAPAADVYETDEELVVELEVPGFDEEQLEIRVDDHTLAVTGERQESTDEDGKTIRLHERIDTRFERRFLLPIDIDSKHVKAEYAKGVLTVHVPKAAHETPQKVAITKL
jgi:HSP20 family protein